MYGIYFLGHLLPTTYLVAWDVGMFNSLIFFPEMFLIQSNQKFPLQDSGTNSRQKICGRYFRRCVDRIAGSVRRQIAEAVGEKNQTALYNGVHLFSVNYFTMTHWHTFSQHGYFTCPGSFWADLCYLAQQYLLLEIFAQAQQVHKIIGIWTRKLQETQSLFSTFTELL